MSAVSIAAINNACAASQARKEELRTFQKRKPGGGDAEAGPRPQPEASDQHHETADDDQVALQQRRRYASTIVRHRLAPVHSRAPAAAGSETQRGYEFK